MHFNWIDFLKAIAEIPTLWGVALGALIGGGAAALAGTLLSYMFARRLFRIKVLDEARRELRGPMHDYMEWLNTVSADFSVWKTGFFVIQGEDKARDRFELNRLRRLFVDQRNADWMSRLEEYEVVLGRFQRVVKELWMRQISIGERFHGIVRRLEKGETNLSEPAEIIENLAFEQAQLVSDLLFQLQYQCLKAVADRRPRRIRGLKPRIERSFFGEIRVREPKSDLNLV